MKLTPDTIEQLEKLIQLSVTTGIKKLIIEKDKVRGVDDSTTVVIVSPTGVPDLSGKQVGINRLDTLAARISLVKSQGNVEIDAQEAPNKTGDIALLDLKGGSTKAQFRCASIEAVKGVPKQISDTLVWRVKVQGKVLPVLTQAVNAMGADALTLASKDGKTVQVECVDSNKDVFTTDLEDPAEWIGKGTCPGSFCQKYKAKNLLTLLKEAVPGKTGAPVEIELGEGGILSVKVAELSFFMVPATG